MAQKYKVFFNNSKLIITKKSSVENISFDKTFVNPDKSVIAELILTLFKIKESSNYLIITDNVKQTWDEFKSFFEVRKAAGGVVINNKKHILFIKRNGMWDLPKGHLEKNEKSKTAAVREIEEECGISGVKITDKLIKTYHTYILKKRIVLKPVKWYLMSYNGNETPVPQTKEGITKVVWVNNKEAGILLNKAYSSIVEVINKFEKRI
jgi:8-oxo-dGTP pyrophosphatase MutT (NUDIX family)